MRITNSMLVNHFMNNYSHNLERLDKLQNQLASGRKFAHISDDPVSLIYSRAARNRIARLSHYQATVNTAQDWLRSVETGVMDLQGRVADVYEEVINAATDVKNSSDKNNIAFLVKQLRDHYLDTLNATFGDKYMYAGYNTPGDSASGKLNGPFKFANGQLTYNDYNLSALLTIDNINLASAKVANLNNEISDAMKNMEKFYPWLSSPGGFDIPTNYDGELGILGSNDIADRIEAKIADIAALDPESHNYHVDLNRMEIELAGLKSELSAFNDELYALRDKWDKRATALAGLEALCSGAGVTINASVNDKSTVVDNIDISYNPTTGMIDRLRLDVGGVPTDMAEVGLTGVSTASRLEYKDFSDLLDVLRSDVLTFDVGAGVSMEVTINGIDLVLYQTVADDGKPVMRNIFSVLDELSVAASGGASAEELGRFIKPLQDAQNHLLTKVAEIGGKTRRLELLAARYETDALNYEQMKSDAEDADMAEVIMNQKMAEAVYQAALSSGARIIQPTLMDFLR